MKGSRLRKPMSPVHARCGVVRLSPSERTTIRTLSNSLHNRVVVKPTGSNTRHTIHSVIWVGDVYGVHHSWQGKIGRSITVISSDREVWVMPHRPETLIVEV